MMQDAFFCTVGELAAMEERISRRSLFPAHI